MASPRPSPPPPAPTSSDSSPESLDELIPSFYLRLRQLARRQLQAQRAGHTLDSAALVHELYVKLSAKREVKWEDSAHFLALAVHAMRNILVDSARRRRSAKRGGGEEAVELEGGAELLSDAEADRLLQMEQALTLLAEVDELASRLVEYRCFAGLTLEEAADLLGLSYPTARRRWSFAKAWLRRHLAQER